MPITDGRQLATELAALERASVTDLRQHWRKLFRKDCPPAFGPDLLRRHIAYRLQEVANGGLDKETSRLLNALIAQSANSSGKITLPRRIKAGAILVRDWKGERHRITVAEHGFTYRDKPFDNLSQIARLITGTRWNGPRFFGLRAAGEQQ